MINYMNFTINVLCNVLLVLFEKNMMVQSLY